MNQSRRTFLNRLGSGVLVVAGAGLGLKYCDQLPDSAIQAWDGPDDNEEDIRKWALGYAILAPSPNNMQPWKVDLREENVITLYIDQERLLPETDPFARQIMIGHGGFVESLQIAAKEKGYRADITYFPQGTLISGALEKKPVASIRFVEDESVQPDPLFAYLLQRRSNGQFYQTTLLKDEHLSALKQAMDDRDTRVSFVSEHNRVGDIKLLAAKAVGIEMTNLPTMTENINTTRIGASSIDEHRDGNRLHGPSIWWLQKTGRLSESNASSPGSMGYNAIFANATSHLVATPGFVLFKSPGNSRVEQLEIGRSYLRFNLLATQLGVSLHPVNHVLQDYPEMAETRQAFLLASGTATHHVVQMLVRIGYALEDIPPPSARRPLEEIFIEEENT